MQLRNRAISLGAAMLILLSCSDSPASQTRSTTQSPSSAPSVATADSPSTTTQVVASTTTDAPSTTTGAPSTTVAEGIAGSSGVGDPLLPLAGNGGYDVGDYNLTMSWDPQTNVLDASVVVRAIATANLSSFNLDLRGFEVAAIQVNDQAAAFSRDGQELVITPPEVILQGAPLIATVTYSGVPETIFDNGAQGWIPIAGGAVVLSEPKGSPGWFPVNDHPSDKATFSLSMTVPSSLQVVSNGLPDTPVVANGLSTYRWTERNLMAPYLATVAIGDFVTTTDQTSNGIPIINAVVPALADQSTPALKEIPAMVEWLSELYGPFPFDSTGAVVVDEPNIGYALETQGRPTFTAPIDDSVMVHELAHQWVGDSVSVATWPEIWLNEGFATYTEWLWSEHIGRASAEKLFTATYNSYPTDDEFWAKPPGPKTMLAESDLFGAPVYQRGAMTLHVLRNKIGDEAFFYLLNQWTTTQRNANATTAEFIALAEQVSNQSLTDLFELWLSTPGRPPL